MAIILVICTGNVCRSPMAAALLQVRLGEDEKRHRWRVLSAGTGATSGRPASVYAIQEMIDRGIDLGNHRSCSVNAELMQKADLVLTMTANHAETLAVSFPDQVDKVHLLTEVSGKSYDVSDPYGGTRLVYAYIAQELEDLIDQGYENIVEMVEDARQAR